MDALDILAGRANQTFSGKYYARLPHEQKLLDGDADIYSRAPEGEYFEFEYASTVDRSVRTLFSRVETDAETVAIRTTFDLDFKPHGYVLLEDGKLYTIEGVTTDRSKNTSAARFGFMPVAPEKVISLVERENPWL